MADLSARKCDAHYRLLGLMPRAKPEEVGQAARSLKVKLQPEKLNNSPLKDIVPIRIAEIDESTMHLNSYWQRCGVAPPSIQKRTGAVFPAFPVLTCHFGSKPFSWRRRSALSWLPIARRAPLNYLSPLMNRKSARFELERLIKES